MLPPLLKMACSPWFKVSATVFPVLFFVLISVLPATEGIHCFVCHSVNGSNPDCELGDQASETVRKTLQYLDCRTAIGAPDKKTRIMGLACTTMLGNYRDRASGQILYGLSRQCTGSIPQSQMQSDVHCGDMDTHGILGDVKEVITGCAELCTENNCNGHSISRLAPVLRRKFEEYVKYLSLTDPAKASRLRFPSVFAAVEAQRLNELPGASSPRSTGNLACLNIVQTGILFLTSLLLLVHARF